MKRRQGHGRRRELERSCRTQPALKPQQESRCSNDSRSRQRSVAAFRASAAADARRREQPGAGVRRRRREPIFIERAEGAYLYDIDGNRYIDYIGSWGPMILGHRHPEVVAAVEAALAPRHELRRPDRSGERAGRADHRGGAVGREGAAGELRHRSDDERHPPGPRLHGPRRDRQVRRQLPRPRRQPAGGGGQLGGDARRAELARRHRRHVARHAGAASTTTSAGWKQAFAAHGDEIAGVILEPVVGNMGVVVPTPEFVAALNRLTRAARRAADLRRSDDRLPRRLRRRPVAVRASSPTSRRSARSSAAGCRWAPTAAGPRS